MLRPRRVAHRELALLSAQLDAESARTRRARRGPRAAKCEAGRATVRPRLGEGEVTWVAEVKSVTPQNEQRQLRMALGQVLHYRHLLEAGGRTVKAPIAAEMEPSDHSWLDLLCRSAGRARLGARHQTRVGRPARLLRNPIDCVLDVPRGYDNAETASSPSPRHIEAPFVLHEARDTFPGMVDQRDETL